MPANVTNGAAFEWAVAVSTSKELGIGIEESVGATKSKAAFNACDKRFQEGALHAARLAVKHILKVEGTNPAVIKASIVRFNPAAAGQRGDVRDVVLEGAQSSLGISCKNNHAALKHSRLSSKIDFVQEWGLDESGTSTKYFQIVSPVFDQLRKLRTDSNNEALWRDQGDVQSKYYEPILKAFTDELQRVLTGPHANHACKALTIYLFGRRDFYKVINRPTQQLVEIQGWNSNSTLRVRTLPLPSKLVDISRSPNSPGTVIVSLSRGFSFGFRIHNASSRIEPSLKFDVSALGVPPELYVSHIFCS